MYLLRKCLNDLGIGRILDCARGAPSDSNTWERMLVFGLM